jgi:D-hydroxyproline dehydrogenase subunit alpha
MSRVAVVGSGQTGLNCAERLARQGTAVTLFERLPALGGQEPESDIDRLVASAHAARVNCVLGTMAVSLADGKLQTLGVEGAAVHDIDALLVATGARPATRGELGIAGARCAGVVSGPVALHLIKAGVLIGRSPVVLGGGQLACECATLLIRAGSTRVTVVAPGGLLTEFPSGAEIHEGWMIKTISGSLGRVAGITVDSPGETLTCDAVILAHQRRPIRNIEGAVFEGEHVVFCHSTADPKSEADAREAAEIAVDEVREALVAVEAVR